MPNGIKVIPSSTPAHRISNNHTALLFIQSDLNTLPVMMPLQETIGQEALERYVALEEKIAALEESSPDMVVAQKQEQLNGLQDKLRKQHELVRDLEAAT